MEPVVFLDLDGVVFKEWDGRGTRHDPILQVEWVAHLSRICEASGAKVVIASQNPQSYEWDFIQQTLIKEGGFTGEFHPDWRTKSSEVLGLSGYDRAGEIADWLQRNPHENWVWLDDWKFWKFRPGQKERLVWAAIQGVGNGLAAVHIEQVLAILCPQ